MVKDYGRPVESLSDSGGSLGRECGGEGEVSSIEELRSSWDTKTRAQQQVQPA